LGTPKRDPLPPSRGPLKLTRERPGLRLFTPAIEAISGLLFLWSLASVDPALIMDQVKPSSHFPGSAL